MPKTRPISSILLSNELLSLLPKSVEFESTNNADSGRRPLKITSNFREKIFHRISDQNFPHYTSLAS